MTVGTSNTKLRATPKALDALRAKFGDKLPTKVIEPPRLIDPPTPTERKRWRNGIARRAARLRKKLAKRWPQCFVAAGETPRPLKIGIHKDILAAAPEIEHHDLINMLTAYASDSAYLAVIVKGAWRVGLDGAPTTQVTSWHATYYGQKKKRAKNRSNAAT